MYNCKRGKSTIAKQLLFIAFAVVMFAYLVLFNTNVYANADTDGDTPTEQSSNGNNDEGDDNNTPSNTDPGEAQANTPTNPDQSGAPADTPTNQDQSGDPENTPTNQDQSGDPENTPTNQDQSGEPANTPTNQDPSGEPANTPTNQDPSGEPAPVNIGRMLMAGPRMAPPQLGSTPSNTTDTATTNPGTTPSLLGSTSPSTTDTALTTTGTATTINPGTTPDKDSNGYNYDATRDTNPDHNGVYVTPALAPNNSEAAVIGFSSIADKNLTTPTTESPAIIQGAAVGYEVKTGATTYEKIKDRDYPYQDFLVKTISEKGQDGTTHTKLSGYDKTYVIARLNVNNFFPNVSDVEDYFLHVKIDNNRAIMPDFGMESTNDVGKEKGGNVFTDSLGNRTASYSLKYLRAKAQDLGRTFVDIILYSTSSIVAGADAGKTDVPNGDVPVQFYVDKLLQYNDAYYDPTATYTDPQAQVKLCLEKFFNATEAAKSTVNNFISSFLVKGSELKLETAVDNSDSTGSRTTYWSLQKSFEDPYYDLPEDLDPSDPGCGRTIKLINEVAITDNLTLQGADANHLKKRTLDVNTFDVQVANNTSGGQGDYTDGFMLENGWLTIEDTSRTTGAEVAIGNNAKFTIAKGGKLIIDDSCQLEVEWDGATTAPGTQPADPSTLNNGKLDLQAGGELVNNGVITIEGYEGKPTQPGQQSADTSKGCGEMTIDPGATLTNNGTFVVNGKLYNLGTLVNNGLYTDVLVSNDPDKGLFEYHKGIIVSWKDDVTQPNVKPGNLTNGMDENGKKYPDAVLVNNGSILLAPGTLDNYATIYNNKNAGIYMATVTEAIIPIEPTPENPTVIQKRINLDKPQGSFVNNYGTIYNAGDITTASVELRDNLSLGKLTVPGLNPEYSWVNNQGSIYTIRDSGNGTEEEPASNNNTINEKIVILDLPTGVVITRNGKEEKAELIMYNDGSFEIKLANDTFITGSFTFYGDKLVFVLSDGSVIIPQIDSNGNYVFRFVLPDGTEVVFILTPDEVARYLSVYKSARSQAI